MTLGFLKGEPRQRIKARVRRRAAKIVRSVRQQCVERDGYCRTWGTRYQDVVIADVGWEHTGLCEGPSEWAHLGDLKRYKTRGQPPEVRHTTAGSLMLCTKHHRAYDNGRMEIIGDDANLPLRFRVPSQWLRMTQ